MVKIYKTTDRLSVKIDSLKFKLAPLSFDQKAEIQSYLISGEAMAVVKAAKLAIKYSVKDIQGVENLDGSPYELEMENGSVSDSCIDDLLNIDQDGKLSLVCTSMLQGIPTDFVDPQSGEKVKGISIERPSSRKKK